MYKLERSHKALLLLASVVVKTFLMAIVSSYVFCGSTNPNVLFFICVENVPFVGGSIAAVAIMGALFGYYISKLRSFDLIFPNLMMGDFIVTAMYFGASFSAPSFIASKAMIWLFGVWILGMLLAPFNKDHTTLKKVTEYGALVALGTLLTAHFIPFLQEYESSYTVSMMVTSVLSLFGAGRDR
ncbi:MAG TPA: hypothetical protein VD710_00850 [Nitrososphaeraceae archaeon]|nr:hypothetical protein [Nitrososphaeraceae archaeon]